MPQEDPQLRIGELSRRVDVDPALLRAWEKRYGLLAPRRSDGNFRLYSLDDVARVRAMKGHLARGLAAAEAAQLALARPAPREPADVPGAQDRSQVVAELYSALAELDEQGAYVILDRAFALNSLEEVLGEIILPCLRKIGDCWQQGEITVAQEHFGSALLRGTLFSLTRGWSSGEGRTAVLACLPGEQHDIGLICFGLILWRHGWRIVYVGQDTPLGELQSVVDTTQPELVVVIGLAPGLFGGVEDDLRSLAAVAPLAVAGADPEIASRVDAMLLENDVIAAALTVAAMPPPSSQ
jgi:DNA-binding transcriptional MerR regulator